MPQHQPTRLSNVLAEPFEIAAELPDGWRALTSRSGQWEGSGVEVRFVRADDASPIRIEVVAPDVELLRIAVRWKLGLPSGCRMLGDAWERSYGELEWLPLDPRRPLPWYFLWSSVDRASGIGVKTGGGSFAFWSASDGLLELTLDVRSGTLPVRLGHRTLGAAEIVCVEGAKGESAFRVARTLCQAMCPKPLRAPAPVYGFNDWYYAYGDNSEQSILRDTAALAELTDGLKNRPFSVIDDGWQAEKAVDGGPWSKSQPAFPDMSALADRIKALGCRPGIWFRPLMSSKAEGLPESWFRTGFTLDPTIPEVLEKVRQDMRTFRRWGYQLVKHDYSTFDMVGLWGFDFGTRLYKDGVRFHDRARTTAEAILDLYRAIREGAGDLMLIGCNTVGHLAAGLHEIQRIGDDTSGREWARTVKMGVNALAFRSVQQGTFFEADADCVPITPHVPWNLTEQWLRLVAESGTPLFVSADPKAMTGEVRASLTKMLRTASEPQPVAEPLDWLETKTPTRWKLRGREVRFSWSETGVA